MTSQDVVGELQIYRGYEDSDVDLLQSYITHSASIETDHYVDGFGVRTLFTAVPFCTTFTLDRLALPIPDDGFHSEGAEYVALVDCVSRASSSEFCAVEIGAGWGPWISLAGVMTRDLGVKEVSLVGIEAHPARFAQMREHLAYNHLRPIEDSDDTALNNVHCRLINGAAGVAPGWLWFPDTDVTDMGSAASVENTAQDYRGASLKHIQVRAYSFDEIVRDLTHIDFCHIDIQGLEYDLVAANIVLLSQMVSGLVIGTHSRVIEGKLIELLYASGWYLHREKPCRANWTASVPSITGLTTVDGFQYWRRR